MKAKLMILSLLLVTVAFGQPGSDMGMNPQNMDAVRIWKLTEVLELSEDQTVSFLPIVQIHERKLRDKSRELREITKQAHELLEDKSVSQKDVDKILKEYTQKQAEIMSIKEDFTKDLPKYLSPKQQILYLGFEARFRNDLREFMKDRKGGNTNRNKHFEKQKRK